jgi:transposase
LSVSERARLRELEREARELKMENEFLKKAAAYAGDHCQVPLTSSVSRIFR